MASRLFVEVRERRGLSYGIDAGETVYSDAGLWSVEWQCAPGKLPQILALVRSTLADVAAHGITEDELARAKGQMRGQTALSYEGPGSRMSRLGVNAILGDERTLADFQELPLTPCERSRQGHRGRRAAGNREENVSVDRRCNQEEDH